VTQKKFAQGIAFTSQLLNERPQGMSLELLGYSWVMVPAAGSFYVSYYPPTPVTGSLVLWFGCAGERLEVCVSIQPDILLLI
jgi:hypothetical protein